MEPDLARLISEAAVRWDASDDAALREQLEAEGELEPLVQVAGPLDGSTEDAPSSRLVLTLNKTEAAEALGISVDSLERHVLAELRTVQVGARVLIPRTELEDWLRANARRALKDDG